MRKLEVDQGELISEIKTQLQKLHFKEFDQAELSMLPLHVAFPKGFVATLRAPRSASLAVVPDDGSHIEQLIEDAATDALAFDAVCCRAAFEMRSGQLVNSKLAHFASDVLYGLAKRPKDTRGRKSKKHAQHQAICKMVEFTTRHGLQPTRNDESDHTESGCDVVARALKEMGLRPQTYSHIKRVWGARSRV